MDICVAGQICVKISSPSPFASIVFDCVDRLKRGLEFEIGEKGGGSGVLSRMNEPVSSFLSFFLSCASVLDACGLSFRRVQRSFSVGRMRCVMWSGG